MKRAIVVGASSGIGEALALVLSQEEYAVGLTGRRVDRLEALRARAPGPAHVKFMDLARQEEAMAALKELIGEMGGADLIVINSGVHHHNPEGKWEKERSTIEVNVSGFAAAAGVAMDYFLARGGGHIVGISSVAALCGNDTAHAYNASKAFVSNYMEGFRKKAVKRKIPLAVTDVRPGYVDTELIKEMKSLFWVSTPEKAARQIFSAIRRRRKRVYITRRWWLIGWLLRWAPDWIFYRG